MGKDIVGYDITIPADSYPSHWELGNALSEWCKKFTFQLELSESGYKHWQCRVHLIKAKTPESVIKQIAPIIKGNWSPTSNETHTKGSFNYVMKADTRVEGPWKDEDFANAPVMTRQLSEFVQYDLRPWQQQIFERVQVPDNRSIIMIYDTIGNSGKSIFAEYLEYKQLAFELPPLRAFEDIMQFAFGFKDQKCYLVDMPRAMKKDKLSEFYSGLECLKNGVVWDKRYNAKKRRMDRPNIIVFTNTLPAFEFMSADRWEVYEMTHEFCLKAFSGAAL